MIDQALMTRVMEFMAGRSRDSADTLLTSLRVTFQGVHFSVCSDGDVPPRLRAAAQSSFCRLYYVDSGGHCLRLTNEAEAATGLVVALLDEDEP